MRCVDILACVLRLLSQDGREPPERCQYPRAEIAALAIRQAQPERLGVDPAIVASVMAGESCFRPRARGAKGEVGLLQLKRGGALTGSAARWPARELQDPAWNTAVGVSYLAELAARWPEPHRYLSRWNGRAPKPSAYSRRVLDRLRQARRLDVGG